GWESRRREARRLEKEYHNEEVKDKIHEHEIDRKKKERGAAEQALIDMFGRERRLRERELEVRTKFPVPQVLVSGGETTPYLPLPMPRLVRPIEPPGPPPSEWTIEMANDEEGTPASRAEITRTTRGDDTRKHDGEADDEETAAARADVTGTTRSDDTRKHDGDADGEETAAARADDTGTIHADDPWKHDGAAER